MKKRGVVQRLAYPALTVDDSGARPKYYPRTKARDEVGGKLKVAVDTSDTRF